MQLASSLARELGIQNRYDPKENIKGGIKHIINLLKRYKKYPDQIELALAAYNAGPSVVDRYKDIPPIKETEDFVKKVMRYYYLFKNG